MGEPWTLGLAKLSSWIEAQCCRLRSEGLNPAIIVDKLRPFTQQIWRQFTGAEKREFCDRHRSRWGVARHRIAPEVAARVEAALTCGRLKVVRGAIRELRPDGGRIVATIETGPETREFTVGLLVNCTGPRERFSDTDVPLYRNLFARGLVAPDEIDLGLRIAPNFGVVDREGRESNALFAFGPLVRGTLWETTAVPELRSQAFHIAKALLADPPARARDWQPGTPADLLEYQI
jgi:uncharacterized NAD(P)/FAD-binding protein YdhS